MGEGLIQMVINHSKATGTSRVVLMSLAHYAEDKTGLSFVPVERLSHYANSTPRSVWKCLKLLEESGEISRGPMKTVNGKRVQGRLITQVEPEREDRLANLNHGSQPELQDRVEPEREDRLANVKRTYIKKKNIPKGISKKADAFPVSAPPSQATLFSSDQANLKPRPAKDDLQLRIDKFFGHRASTKWSGKDQRLYAKGKADLQEGIEALEKYYLPRYNDKQLEEAKNKGDSRAYRRKNLNAFLNNIAGEIAKADNWIAEHGTKLNARPVDAIETDWRKAAIAFYLKQGARAEWAETEVAKAKTFEDLGDYIVARVKQEMGQ